MTAGKREALTLGARGRRPTHKRSRPVTIPLSAETCPSDSRLSLLFLALSSGCVSRRTRARCEHPLRLPTHGLTTAPTSPQAFVVQEGREMLFSNIDDGYLEGLLRGYRSGVLTSADYANLCQCESIDGTVTPRPATQS